MIVTLQTERVRTLEDARAFLTSSQALDFNGVDRQATCDLVRRTLVRLNYDHQNPSRTQGTPTMNETKGHPL